MTSTWRAVTLIGGRHPVAILPRMGSIHATCGDSPSSLASEGSLTALTIFQNNEPSGLPREGEAPAELRLLQLRRSVAPPDLNDRLLQLDGRTTQERVGFSE